MSFPRPRPLGQAISNALKLLLVAGCASASASERTLDAVLVVGQPEAQVERKNAEIQKIVVSEEEVERFGDATVGDVLRRLPGMSFTGPAGVTKDVRMRGLDKGYTQFLINGEPVPGAAPDRQMQVDRLPADMIERIEIIRNPSAQYDAGGIGGTVNIILKHRADNSTRLRAAFGQNGSLKVGDAVGQWSRNFGKLDVLLALSHTVGAEDIVENKDTFNASGAITRREHKPRPVEKAETLFAPRLTWTLGDDRLTLDPYVSVGSEDKLENAEVRNLAGSMLNSTSSNEDKTDRLARVGGRYDGTTAWGSWFAKLGVQQGSSDKDKQTRQANGAGVVTKRSHEKEAIEEDQQYAGLGGERAFGSHTLSAGMEWRTTEYDKRKVTAEANNATAALTPKPPGANDIYFIREKKEAIYLQDEWHVATDHWLTAGLRYERVDRTATDRNGLSRNSTNSATNPSLHYRWAFVESTNFRTSVAQTLRMPKFDDINPLVTLATGAGAGTITKPDKGGNADLASERAIGIEMGVEHFFHNSHGVLGVNVYNRKVDDYIQKVARLEGSRYVERPDNVGEARFWGAELDWRLPLLRSKSQQLTLTGSHAELRGEVIAPVTGTRSDVKDLPPRVSTLGLDWRQRPSRWSAGFSLNYVPQFTSDSLNADGVRELKHRDEQILLDGYFGVAFNRTFELRLIAKNLLGVEKEEYTSKYNANGSFNAAESRVESSEPSVFLTFESRF